MANRICKWNVPVFVIIKYNQENGTLFCSLFMQINTISLIVYLLLHEVRVRPHFGNKNDKEYWIHFLLAFLQNTYTRQIVEITILKMAAANQQRFSRISVTTSRNDRWGTICIIAQNTDITRTEDKEIYVLDWNEWDFTYLMRQIHFLCNVLSSGNRRKWHICDSDAWSQSGTKHWTIVYSLMAGLSLQREVIAKWIIPNFRHKGANSMFYSSKCSLNPLFFKKIPQHVNISSTKYLYINFCKHMISMLNNCKQRMKDISKLAGLRLWNDVT